MPTGLELAVNGADSRHFGESGRQRSSSTFSTKFMNSLNYLSAKPKDLKHIAARPKDEFDGVKGLTLVRSGRGSTHGFYAKEDGQDPPRLLTYKPQHLKAIFAILTQLDLTVFTLWRSWLVSIFFAGVTAAIEFAIAIPDEGHLHDVQQLRLNALETLLTALTSLTAFVIGGFIAFVVASWNRRRSIYDGLMGQSRMLLIALDANVTPRVGEKDADVLLIREARRELSRYILLAAELAMLDARGHQDDERGKRQLEEMGLLRPGEWETTTPGDRMTTVYSWLARLVSSLVREGVLPTHILHPITAELAKTRALSRDMMTIFSLDAPYPYASLVGTLVQARRVALCTASRRIAPHRTASHRTARNGKTAAGCHGARAQVTVAAFAVVQGLRGSLKEDSESRGFLAVTTFAYSLLLQALFNLHSKLGNPFLRRRIDCAHELAWNQLRLLTTQMLETDETAPRFPAGSALATRLGMARSHGASIDASMESSYKNSGVNSAVHFSGALSGNNSL
jgi:hypothetical protein